MTSPRTRIEDIIVAYTDGQTDWPETKAALVAFPYEQPEWNRGRNLVTVEGHDAFTERDTFAEVEFAYHAGKLTRDEFYGVLTAYQRRVKREAKQQSQSR